MNMRIRFACGLVLLAAAAASSAEIPPLSDAPRPLSPEQSAQRFRVPPGFRVELVASEPLVREPTGVCWDERGRLFVCELHGYNLEGQYDIEELNRTGKLDRVVRRVQAAERHKQAAEAETYGTIKQLRDTDGDGRMDAVTVWADRLPPCLGICPARGGLIAACQTQILFLADRDDDGRAELREVLFEGFAKGPLERSINCPQWGPGGWIYLGIGAGGGTIRGKYLPHPVELPRTDFRIRADGSAIEPVVGSTGTMGFAFTEAGDRFVVSTRTPGIFVAPLAWRHLARNRDVPAPSLTQPATSDQRVWPTSQPHPWRTRRAEDPGFSKYYRDRYGIQESAPNGYFTSACSPLVYRDVVLPGLNGQLLACEPAQNMVHRASVARDGARLVLERLPAEAEAEFLTSRDPWFHAISLAHAPDGTIYIVDFYREIIEDYSAIPRYLQQQYGLSGGKDHGRIWRLTHTQAQETPAADMSRLTPEQLAAEVASPHFWRRQTARRLLVEGRQKDPSAGGRVAEVVAQGLQAGRALPASLNSLATLAELNRLQPRQIQAALADPRPEVRRRGLQLAEPLLNDHTELLTAALDLAADPAAMVRLQLALTLGETRDPRALAALAQLARTDADQPWMDAAIMSSVAHRAGRLLSELLEAPETLAKGELLLAPLSAAIANRREAVEFSSAVVRVAALTRQPLQVRCLQGIRAAITEEVDVALSDPARGAIKQLASSDSAAVRNEALPLISRLRLESPAQRRERLRQAARDIADVQLPAPRRLAAAAQLAEDRAAESTAALLDAFSSGTDSLRGAILAAVLEREERIPALLDALEAKRIAPSLLTSVQRSTLREAGSPAVRQRAAKLLGEASGSVDPQLRDAYHAALQGARDLARGQQVYRAKCANCHRAHGLGHAVGPDLTAEFMRSEETLLDDVLTPSAKLTAGFVTYAITTDAGQVYSGLLASESPTSITLKQPEGKQRVVLRKSITQLRALPVSLMPDDLAKTVSPRELADVIAWIRRPPATLVLLDENRGLVDALRDGAGTAEFDSETAAFAGRVSLRVTPPQRHSSRIAGWSFPIREHPGPGEFRYLRFAWKAPAAQGAMLELADAGRWPPAEKALRRYHAGRNMTGWGSLQTSPAAPREWTVVTRDLWKDFGDFTLTGIAPTAMGGPVWFDMLELRQSPAE